MIEISQWQSDNCEICNPNKSLNYWHDHNYGVDSLNGESFMKVTANGTLAIVIPVKFCPECGRRLENNE